MVYRSKLKQLFATDTAQGQQTGNQQASDGVDMGEIVAAIGMALRQYEGDLHDTESNILTIRRVAQTYSPWNSKIYGTENWPIKNTKR